MKTRVLSAIRKRILVLVSAAAIVLLAVGTFLVLGLAKEMREQVGGQFNEEQLIIARHISNSIQRELGFLKKEIHLLGKEISLAGPDSEAYEEKIQKCFSRVLEKGVWEIEMCDLYSQVVYVYTPYGPWSKKEAAGGKCDELPSMEDRDKQEAWISRPQLRPSGVYLLIAVPVPGARSRLLLFEVNLSWFLTPMLKDIRSGKTGYCWVIDAEGNFLFHPVTDFVGKSAFEAREKKYPGISYGEINFIQKEQMLKGQEGLGWYFSGWHRGITGETKKFIAYSPIPISDHPPQNWSSAVVAPVSEIERAVREIYMRQFLLQGLVILIILLGGTTILFFEMRWSRVLEKRVQERTEELKRSEEKYRSLVESAEDFIFAVDSEGRFLSMNSFTANFFGGHPEEFLGKDLSCVFPEKVSQKQLRLISKVYEHRKSFRDEFEIKMGEHQLWISANFMPLRNEEGQVTAVLCIARDITENKKLEIQLISTEKLASIGTLAAGVAHEINNPLGVILGFCDLLLRKSDRNSQEYEDLRTIERQGLHCKQVVDNLLSFARFRKEASEYSDLTQCMEEIIQVVKHTLEINLIDLILQLTDNMPKIRGDYRQLQQVFLNLINNAVSAMPEGGTLTIRTSRERGSRRAVIQFQDTGSGVKEEDLDHIFEPFFTTKPEGEGTGLGLFVSYGIITKYGGTITCKSQAVDSPKKPRGTTFTIKLPISQEER